MLLKILIALAVFMAIWLTLFRVSRKIGLEPDETPPRPVKPPTALVRCPGCGIYLPDGQSCDCRDRS